MGLRYRKNDKFNKESSDYKCKLNMVTTLYLIFNLCYGKERNVFVCALATSYGQRI